jgi:hypothetical protein
MSAILSGKPILHSQGNRPDLANATGTLPVANGGTGTTTGSITGSGALAFTAGDTITLSAGGSNKSVLIRPTGTGILDCSLNPGKFSNLEVAAAANLTWTGRGILQITSGGVLEVRNSGFSALITFNSLYERHGTGTPEGAVAAPVGAIFHRTDGGTGTSLYVKETGAATNTGWVAK